MTIAPFVRRWGVLTLGSVFLLLGVVVLTTHLTLGVGWTVNPAASDMALYPGLPSTQAAPHDAISAAHYASLGGQISVALGVTLIAGWVGFALGGRTRPVDGR